MPDLAVTHTPTPWFLEKADGTNNHQHCMVYELTDANGKTIADCHNSEVADIQCDPDEDGSHCWDEQGRKDFEFILLSVNSHDALVTALTNLLKASPEPALHSFGYEEPPGYMTAEDNDLARVRWECSELLKQIAICGNPS
jgi:hypothetical protein